VADDPWNALAIALARAKKGDFRFVPRLMELMDGTATDILIVPQFSELLAYASPDATLDAIEQRLHTPDDYSGDLVIDFCEALANRGRLSDVPTMLEAYVAKAYVKDADIIPVYLSDMLEEETSVMSEPNDLPSIDAYRELVLNRQEELAKQLGNPTALVYWGGEYSVERLARLMLRVARGGWICPKERQRFEAATGIDCSAFFKKKRKQPLTAAAMLEEFIQTEAYARYRPGQRYFFGHPIPPA
jgi:hypothetical protein